MFAKTNRCQRLDEPCSKRDLWGTDCSLHSKIIVSCFWNISCKFTISYTTGSSMFFLFAVVVKQTLLDNNKVFHSYWVPGFWASCCLAPSCWSSLKMKRRQKRSTSCFKKLSTLIWKTWNRSILPQENNTNDVSCWGRLKHQKRCSIKCHLPIHAKPSSC